MKRVQDQRQQVSNQIDQKSRNLGKIISNKPSKYYRFGGQELVPVSPGESPVFVWRKTTFSKQRSTTYYAPYHKDFAGSGRNSIQLSNSYYSSSTGSINDRKIQQYLNVRYSISVYRSTPTSLSFPVRCAKSMSIVVDGQIVYRSGSDLPSSITSVSINIPGQKWTNISVYFYSSAENEDENFIDFEIPLLGNVEQTRHTDPAKITITSASKGKYLNSIRVSWTTSDLGEFSRFQIFYGTADDDVSDLLATDLAGDISEFVHAGLEEGQHYFYKVRAYNESGQFGDFGEIVEGWSNTTSLDSVISLEFQPNSDVGTIDSIGYYGNEVAASGKAYVKITSTVELVSSLYLTAIDPNGSTIHTGVLSSTLGTNKWMYYFTVSSSSFNEGTAYVTASSSVYVTSGNFVVDKTKPRFNFVLDGDGYFNLTNDPFCRSTTVYINTTSGHDPEDTVFANLDGDKIVSDIYQMRIGNYTADNMSGGSWIDFQSNQTPISWSVENPTGYKTVYAQVRDLSGNISDFTSDSIYFATGNIQNVTPLAIETGYDRIKVRWSQLNIPDLQGYVVYRKVNDSTEPNSSYQAYAYLGQPTITSFTDPYVGAGGNVYTGSGYHYWIKGFTQFGELSSGFALSPSLSGQLRVAPPSANVHVNTGTKDEKVWFSFKNSASDDSDAERRGYFHSIYRKDISEFPTTNSLTNSILIDRILHSGGNADTYTYYDTVPNPSSFYQYYTVPENKYGFKYSSFTSHPNASGIRSNDGPPAKPVWDTLQTTTGHYNIHLEIVAGTETDLVGYNIYREEGTSVSNPTGTVYRTIQYNPLTHAGNPIINETRDRIPIPSSLYTYWAQGFDKAGFKSEYSDPQTCGLLHTPPPIPQWVSGECFAWYGYNHLVFSGGSDPYRLLAGYKIYRSTGTDSTLASSVGTISDDRFLGAKNLFDDFEVNYFTEYNYWVTSFNKYGDESNKSASLTGLGFVQPNYGELFSNILDNSSFERTFSNDVNWAIGDSSRIKTDGGAFGRSYVRVRGSSPGILYYSGYIFITPSQQYFLSIYAKKFSAASANLRITGVFYSTDRETQVGAYGFDIPYASLTNNWARHTGGIITAPSNAISASMQIYATAAFDEIDVDAVMLEEYSATVSPRKYVDSRVISADRIQGKVIIGDMIQFNTIKGNRLEANTISGREILAGSITADILKVPGIGNFVPNSSFEQCDIDPDSNWNKGTLPTGVGTQHVNQWYPFAPATAEDPNYSVSDPALRCVTDTLYNAGGEAPMFGGYVYRFKPKNAARRWSSAFIPIVTGINYRLSTYYLVNSENPSATTNAIIGIRAYAADESRIEGGGALGPDWTYDSTSRNYYRDVIDTSVRNTWLRTGYDLVITGADVAKVTVSFFSTSVGNDSDPFFYFDGVKLEHSTFDTDYGVDIYTQIDGWGIRTQSIVAGSIAADAITADKIAANAVTAGKIDAGAVTAGTIATQEIDTDVLRIRSAEHEIALNTSGLTIGNVDADSTYSRFTRDRAEYVVSGEVFNYARRVEVMQNLAQETFYDFIPPYRTVPNVILIPTSLPTVYTPFGANNQHLSYSAVNVTTTGFYLSSNIVSGWTGSAGTEIVNTVGISDLDRNIGTMYLGNSGVSVGNIITGFTSQNWISYDNSTQNYKFNNATINAKMVINSCVPLVYQPYQWNLQFIWGRVVGTELHVSGVLTESGTVSYLDTFPRSINKKYKFAPAVAGTNYGFQIRAYQYSTDPEAPDPVTQTLVGSGQYINAYVTSGGGGSVSVTAVAKYTAIIIE